MRLPRRRARRAGLQAATDQGPRRTRHSHATLADVPIAIDPALVETQPSLAASPRRQDALVVTYVAAAYPTHRARDASWHGASIAGGPGGRQCDCPCSRQRATVPIPPSATRRTVGHLYAAYRNTEDHVERYSPKTRRAVSSG